MSEHPLAPRPGDPTPAEWSRSALGRPAEGGWAVPEDDEASFEWRRYASAVLRYKWIVILAGLLGVGAGYLSWRREVTGEYVAMGSLWLQPEANEQGPIVTEGLLQATSWLDLIQSYAVLDTVVMQQKLYVSPSAGETPLFESFQIGEGMRPGSYVLSVPEGGGTAILYRVRSILFVPQREEVERGTPGGTFGASVGFRWTPPAAELRPGREIEFDLTTPRNAAARLRGDLVPGIDPRVSFIRVSLRGPDPERLGATVNGIMNRHVALAADLKSGNLREQTVILRRQLDSAQADLAAANAALEAFRVSVATAPSEQTALPSGVPSERGTVFDQYFELRFRQEEIREDRERIERVLATPADSEFPVEAIELIPSVQNSSQLMQSIEDLVALRLERQELLERYTSEHATVIDLDGKIRTFERSSIPSLLRQLVGQLESDERSLAARIEVAGRGLSEIPARTIQEEELRLAVTIASNFYTELRQRYEFTSLAQQSSLPDVQILDPAAVSQLPRTADRRAIVAVVLFLAFLGAGVGIAIFTDRMDPHMRTPDEVTTVLGLSVLGVVPRIRLEGEKSDSMDQAREAFRSLRTNLEFAYGRAGPMVVTVSSPGQNEGKTLVTSNLGMCFAELGRRTLIIDGDTRRGDLHRVLNGERKPGLTDYLRGKETAEGVLQSAAHPNLQFIGSGTQVANSPELLSSSRMGELLGELRRRYDVILIDSPPLGVGADAVVLACLSANLVLLFRSGSTHKDFAQARLEPLSRLPMRLLGAVLNDFEPDRLGSGYYQSYYGNYLPGYEAGAEDEERALEGRTA